MFPVKELKLRSKVTSEDKFPIERGISPVRFPFERTRVVRRFKDRTWVGKLVGRLMEVIVTSET
uniref:Uncharacterized protein n=1 Tax=Rhizophora mucronata TaxID=61149 RepID=A0A2P2NCJ7_RHIMU